MYHSLIFSELDGSNVRNTWDDWHLVPSSRPVFNPPVQKTLYMDIPGADGSLDLSEAVTKYPIYENRTGFFEFIVMNGYEPWNVIYEKVTNYLNGRVLKCIMEDEQPYYYEGRFRVSEWDSANDGSGSKITIDYNVKPYKNFIQSSSEDWLWDPFSFETGIVQTPTFSNIIITSAWTEYDFSNMVAEKPVVPTFTCTGVDGETYMSLYNPDLGYNWYEKKLQNGTIQYPDIVLSNNTKASVLKMKFKGTGIVTIDFRSGRI